MAEVSPGAPIARDAAALMVARVLALVRACPPGRVTTYGWIGAALGYPGGSGARMVGWVLNETLGGGDVPAQRVINSKGELTGSWAFGKRGRMRELLESEGIQFGETGAVNLKRHGWDPRKDLSGEALAGILAAADPASAYVSENLLHLLRDDPASPVRIRPSAQP